MENCRKNCGNFLEGIEFRPMKVAEYPLLADFLYEAIFSAAGRYTAAQRSHRVAGIAALYCGFWQRRRFLSMCGTKEPRSLVPHGADICRDTAVWKECRSWQFPFCRPFEERTSAQFF